MKITAPERGFISYVPASIWEESLISGNGKMGALVMSDPTDETIILSHEKLFLPWHEPIPPVNTAPHLQKIRDMMASGEYQKAADFVVELAQSEGYGPKRWTDMFFPACELLVSTEPAGEVREYARSLDYATGVASVAWSDDRGSYLRRLFVSRPDNVVVMSFKAPQDGLNCKVRLDQRPAVMDDEYWNGPDKQKRGIAGYETKAEDGWIVYTSKYALSDGGYACVGRVTCTGGTAEADGASLVVTGADELLITLRIYPLEKFSEFDVDTARKDLSALPDAFDALLAPHAKAHGEIFSRVRLDLGGGADRNLPAEELVERSHRGELLPAMLEKIVDQGRYAILSSSGDLPPNLQGVWAGSWGAPWSGDYTLNGNVQAAIASTLNGNMPECLHSFFSYMDSLVPACKTNAEMLYGCRGLFLASRTSTHGLQNHFCGTWPMTFWTAGAAWAAQFYYDYYLYTGDREFLKNRALPFMKECAEFYEDFLVEGPDGRFIFSPSYSPENEPSNVRSQACVNATMDIAAAKELLTNLIEASKTLGVEQQSLPRWQEMLEKMPPYLVNSDGAVKEWTHPDLEDNYAHRHCSHLYPLYNGVAPDIADDPALLNAFKRAFDLRAEERKKQAGSGVMAFGLVQIGLAASSLGDSEMVSFVVDSLGKNYFFRNLATSHDPQFIFNTDTSGGLPAVVIKSLVHAERGEISLLPAVPDQMPSGRLTGALCRGQIEVVELEWKPGQARVVLKSAVPQRVSIRLPYDAAEFAVTGGRATVDAGSCTKCRMVDLPAGEPVEMTVRSA